MNGKVKISEWYPNFKDIFLYILGYFDLIEETDNIFIHFKNK